MAKKPSKGPEPESVFPAPDSWLLCSIALVCHDGAAAGLEDIIATGDLINVSIFTHGELDLGLARLIDAGHVVQEGGKFLLSSASGEAIRAIVRPRRRLLDHVERVRRFLGAGPWIPGEHPPATGPGRVVSVAQFKAAVKAYQRGFSR